ncbi:hypothetical protein LTR56_016540 [Elasticomyces elasticus]|nr:hypothetical protein LTR22_025318 [Elasticomyces elasticus]KAK3632055.1 hypothetical protein LTR56_016540 [Elasticomyces elasticus]KAK4931833.1 hypothetical protein LTR49_001900 [Elasticomyces elasticus]
MEDDNDDFEVDPAIAEAMGFAGFGAQPGKKRKYDDNDAFVDPATATGVSTARTKDIVKGANSLPLGNRKKDRAVEEPASASADGQHSGFNTRPGTHAGPSERSLGPGQSDMQALRHGMKNERGDMLSGRSMERSQIELRSLSTYDVQHMNFAMAPETAVDHRRHLFAVVDISLRLPTQQHASITPPASGMSAHSNLTAARAHIEGFLGYRFIDINNLEEALWAYATELPNGRHITDNKKIALVGDAVLKLVVVNDCYEKCSTIGNADDRLKALVNNNYLGNLTRAQELIPFMQLNPGSGPMSLYMKGTAVEGVLGAVSRDCGNDYDTLVKAVHAFGVFSEGT